MTLVSQQRVRQRIAEAQLPGNSPQERISERTQIVDVPVPQILEKLVSQERVQDRSLQRTAERASRDFVEVDKTIPQERISEQMYERSEVIEVPKIAYQCSRLVRLGVRFRIWTCLNDRILLARLRSARREMRHVSPLQVFEAEEFVHSKSLLHSLKP